MNIIFRKAREDELLKIYSLYQRVVDNMQSNGIDQWDSLYPNTAVLAADIDAGDLYLGENEGELVCSFAVNASCEEDYNKCSWKYPDQRYIVVHRLAVNPKFQRQGVGKSAMAFAENLAKEQGVKTIRLDTFCLNPYAKALYEGLGFKILGYTYWRKGKFQIMEKII